MFVCKEFNFLVNLPNSPLPFFPVFNLDYKLGQDYELNLMWFAVFIIKWCSLEARHNSFTETW